VVTLHAWLLAAIAFLSPRGDHSRFAAAVESVVASEPPLFQHDDDRVHTAALVLAVAWHESNFRLDAIGDNGRSVCAMQIYGGAPDLLLDPELCIRTGLGMLRESMRACPSSPLAVYARGRCSSEEGRRLGDRRLALAKKLVRLVKPKEVQ
jgi:hypothetical protein